MTLGLPLFFWLGLLGAGTAVLLHYLTTTRQRPEPFPTVRFVPDHETRHATAAFRFSDLLLLLLRVAALLLIGLGFAQPRFTAARSAIASVVLVDLSMSVARDSTWRAALAGATREAAVVIGFDSTARELTEREVAVLGDSPGPPNPPLAALEPGRLSPALVAGLRAAARLRDRADSLDLVLLAPLLAGATDHATLAIRRLWPGRLLLLPVTALQAQGETAARVEWADSTRGSWIARPPDTAMGVVTRNATLITPFVRRWRWPLDSAAVPGRRVIGRWLDGEPAVVERMVGSACVRTVGFGIPTDGDAPFRPEFSRWLENLRAPCGQPDALEPMAAEVRHALAGGEKKAAAEALVVPQSPVTPLMLWLLVAGIMLLLVELAVRRRGRLGVSA